ncbi:hypothetical protein [Paucibacter sp. Y2R2-4]|uniref:hypothetical protein n=1 Tax=Paucibacter sp. Y2R2-4 TaxID=2893553 RepID=UPI0021E3C843|nr:hypothetical protein [Paucibacter sp. Y2R2-4]MCV2350816.1 hypothetical protein [Paucibacter sp. Y2R2-4]
MQLLRHHMKCNLLIAPLLLWLSPVVAQIPAEVCKSLFQDGLYEVNSSKSRYSQVSIAVEHLCSSTASTVEQARAIGLDFKIPNLPVAIGFTGSSTDFSSFKQSFCSDYYSSTSTSVKLDEYTKRVSTNAAEIVKACTGQRGFSAYITGEYPPTDDFVITMVYNAPPSAPKKLKVTTASPGKKIVCDGGTNLTATTTAVCSLMQGAQSSIIAFNVDPAADMLVSTINYSKTVPTPPPRLTDSKSIKVPVSGTVSLNMGGPGQAILTVSGRMSMNGTKPGPSASINVYVDEKHQPRCNANVSGQDGPQAGDYYCDIPMYVPTGVTSVRVVQDSNNGDPAGLTISAKLEPVGYMQKSISLDKFNALKDLLHITIAKP